MLTFLSMVARRRAEAHTPEWFALRKTMVTASMSSHLMVPGLRWGKDESALRESIRGPSTFVPSEAMEAGTHFEAANMAWFSHVTGGVIQPDGALWTDEDMPWMGASPDGFVEFADTDEPGARDWEPTLSVRDPWGAGLYGDEAVRYLRALPRCLLEAKQTQSRGRSKWKKEQAPEHYECQVQHQLHVLNMDHALLVAKVDSFELWCFHIERNYGYCDMLSFACKEFWEKNLRDESSTSEEG